MKKHANKKFILSVMFMLLALIMMSSSVFAWFSKGSDYVPMDKFGGSIRFAYFNGGGGTAPDDGTTASSYKDSGTKYPSYANDNGTGNSYNGPYQIDNATQLYNFAWLQYLGYFNQVKDGQKEPTPVYFVLTSDINFATDPDAAHIVLPPIGTTENPFVGYFDGNGHSITGLKISNAQSELVNTSIVNGKYDIPNEALSNGSLTDPCEIVGFFGAVGKMTTGGENYQALSYHPSVKNVTLSGASITTQTTNSLAGIAAGYVNGDMEDVFVTDTSTITSNATMALSYTEKLSDYSLVGYCEPDFRRTLDVETVSVSEPVIETGTDGRTGEGGQGNAWGNSIDMKNMYSRLLSVYEPIVNNNDYLAEYPSSVRVTIDRTGAAEVRTEEVLAWEDAPAIKDENNYDNYFLNFSNAFSSYSFFKRTDTYNFMYLYGDNSMSTNAPVTTNTIYIDKASIIYKDTNYLKFTGTGFTNETVKSNSTKWIIDNGRIYTVVQNGTTYVKYYLVNNNGVLGYSSVAANITSVPNDITTWTVGDDVIHDGNYYLTFDNGEWKLLRLQANFITNDDKTHFLTIVDGAIQNNDDRNQVPSWLRTDLDDTYQYTKNKVTKTLTGFTLSCTVNDTTYYLKSKQEGKKYVLELTQNQAEAEHWFYEEPIASTGGDDPGVKSKMFMFTDRTKGTGYAIYYDETANNWGLTPFTAVASGDGYGNMYGKSLPMKEIYDNLSDIYDMASTQYPSYQRIEVEDGQEIITTETDITYYNNFYYSTDSNKSSFKRYLQEGFGSVTYMVRQISNPKKILIFDRCFNHIY